MNKLLFLSVLVLGAGCIHVTTESEIKPIHITMDVNLKVDKELDKTFGEQDRKPAQGPFKRIREMLDRGVAGISNRALLVPREGATEEERILMAEHNTRNRKTFEEVAKESGASVETVQKMRAKRMVELAPAGSGVWYEDDAGAWKQR